MDRPYRTQVFSSGGKELLVTSLNLTTDTAPPALPRQIHQIFRELAPFARNKRQIAYLRDDPSQAIGRHPGGRAINDYELSISLPDWKTDPAHLTDTFAEELHHLVRYQNVGYPRTIGEHLALEATARMYAGNVSGLDGRSVPWLRGNPSQQVYDHALAEWDNAETYDHAQWFYDGPHGKWTGYRLAYRLGQRFFHHGFDLARSLTAPSADFKDFLQP